MNGAVALPSPVAPMSGHFQPASLAASASASIALHLRLLGLLRKPGFLLHNISRAVDRVARLTRDRVACPLLLHRQQVPSPGLTFQTQTWHFG